MRARLIAVVVAALAALLLPVAPAGAGVVAATAPPRIVGAVVVGQAATVAPATWDTEGLTVADRWFVDGVAVVDGPTYTPTASDQGHSLTVRETALQDGAPVGEATSDPVTVLGPAPTSTSAPAISGSSYVGDVLQTSAGTWSRPDLAFTYQWLRDGQPIADATESSYTVTGQDWCRDLAVVVTATQDGYADGVAVSSPFRTSCRIVEPCWIPSSVRLRLVHEVVTPREHPRLKVRVLSAANRIPRSGLVMVRIDKDRVFTKHLRAADQGRLTFRLPRQSAGDHLVQARFDPPLSACLMDSDNAIRLRVRARH